jgi:hypothetical protein
MHFLNSRSSKLVVEGASVIWQMYKFRYLDINSLLLSATRALVATKSRVTFFFILLSGNVGKRDTTTAFINR